MSKRKESFDNLGRLIVKKNSQPPVGLFNLGKH